MKKVASLTVALLFLAFSFGCASSKSLNGFHGGGGGGSAAMASGDWSIVASSGVNGTLGFGGVLTVNGSSVAGNLYVFSDDNCFTPSAGASTIPVTGTITNGNLPLNVVAGGTTFDLNLSVPTGSTASTSLTGTYTASGGCENGNSGNLSATLVSGTVAGTWQGAAASATSGSQSTLTFAFTVSDTPTSTGNLIGTLPITPTAVTLSGPVGCIITGATLNPNTSFTAGSLLFLDVTETENTVPSEFWVFGIVNDVTNPTLFSGEYVYQSGGGCLLGTTSGPQSFAMTKQ